MESHFIMIIPTGISNTSWVPATAFSVTLVQVSLGAKATIVVIKGLELPHFWALLPLTINQHKHLQQQTISFLHTTLWSQLLQPCLLTSTAVGVCCALCSCPFSHGYSAGNPLFLPICFVSAESRRELPLWVYLLPYILSHLQYSGEQAITFALPYNFHSWNEDSFHCTNKKNS